MVTAQQKSSRNTYTLIKKGLFLLLTLIFIAIIALILIVLFVDPNNYKNRIESLARNKANIELSIQGNLSWTLYPWLGIAVTDTIISAIDDSNNPIASASELSLSLKLIALIKGNIEIDQLHVDGLNLSLITYADGSQNIDGFFKQKNITEVPAIENTPLNRQDPSNQDLQKMAAKKADRKLDIRTITFSNTQFKFKDVQKNIEFTGVGIDFIIENVALDVPQFKIKRAQFNQGDITLLDFNTGQGYAYQGINFALQNLKIDRDSSAPQRDFHLSFDQFELDQGKLIYSERDGGQSLIIEPYRIRSSEIMLSTLMKDAEKPWFITLLNVDNLAIYYRAQKDAPYQKIENINFSIAQLGPQSTSPLSFSGNITDFPDLTGAIKGNLTLALNLPTPNIHLTDIDINMRLDRAPGITLTQPMSIDLKGDALFDQNQTLSFAPFTLKIDDSTFTGNLHITDFKNPKGRLNLEGDSLNLNRYMASDKHNLSNSNQINSVPNKDQPSNKTQDKPAFARLSDMNFDISTQLKTFTYDTFSIHDLNLASTIDNAVIQIHQLEAGMLGSNMTFKGNINGQKPIPSLQGKINLTQLPLSNLFQRMKKEIPLRGNLNLSSEFSSSGATTTEIINHLAGNLQANISNGELIGINYEALACEGLSLLVKNSFQKNNFSKNTTPQTTKFKTLSATASIKNGVVQNHSLQMEIPGLSANGGGTINLHRETIDYRIGLHINESTNIPNCKIDRYLKNVTIPLRCQGSFINAGASLCGIDQDAIGKMIADIAQSKIESTLQNKLQEVLPPILQKPKQSDPSTKPKPKDVIKAFEGLFK